MVARNILGCRLGKRRRGCGGSDAVIAVSVVPGERAARPMDLREAFWVASRRARGGMQMSRRGPTLEDRERLGEGVFLAREDSVEVNSLPASLGPPAKRPSCTPFPQRPPSPLLLIVTVVFPKVLHRPSPRRRTPSGSSTRRLRHRETPPRRIVAWGWLCSPPRELNTRFGATGPEFAWGSLRLWSGRSAGSRLGCYR